MNWLLLTGLGLAAVAGSAQAQTLSSASLPSFAQGSTGFAQPSLAPIGGVFAYASPMPGQIFGAGQTVGFSQKLNKDLFVSVQAGSGYASTFGGAGFGPWASGAAGFDFSSTSVKLGYDGGRLRPYVSAGFLSATPVAGYGLSGPDRSLSAALNQPATARTVTSIGAGFDYAVTGNLSFSAGVSVQSSNGPTTPFGFR